MEERNRLLQVQSILKGEEGGLDLPVSRLCRPKARPSVPRVRQPKPNPQPRAVTPPAAVPTQPPHWRSAESRPAWTQRSEPPKQRTSAPTFRRPAQDVSRYAPQERSLAGRTTPPKAKMGRCTPPRAAPKAVARSGADSVPTRGTPPVPSCFNPGARTQSVLTSSTRVSCLDYAGQGCHRMTGTLWAVTSCCEDRPSTQARHERCGSASPPRGGGGGGGRRAPDSQCRNCSTARPSNLMSAAQVHTTRAKLQANSKRCKRARYLAAGPIARACIHTHVSHPFQAKLTTKLQREGLPQPN